MKIPGRVGYQCSNFYRQLIREGVIIDDNYYVNSNNQLTFRFKNRMEHGKQVNTSRPTKRQLSSAKREEEDLDGKMVPELKSKRREMVDYYDIDDENCLPVGESIVRC